MGIQRIVIHNIHLENRKALRTNINGTCHLASSAIERQKICSLFTNMIEESGKFANAPRRQRSLLITLTVIVTENGKLSSNYTVERSTGK